MYVNDLLLWLLFITKTDCVLSEVRAEAEEEVENRISA